MTRRTQFAIGRSGHPVLNGVEDLLVCPRIEMTDGKLFNSHEDRLYVLGLLLESVGVDQAVRMGDPKVWREAIDTIER